MTPKPSQPWVQRLLVGSLLLWSLLLALKLMSTRYWRMEHDTPLIHYVALLMDKFHRVPYRDIFETSMPGSFALHYAIGAWLGFDDPVFRMVDWSMLTLVMAMTWLIMRRFGMLSAAWAIVIFGLFYLNKGPFMSLQRDYIGVVPVVMSLLLVPGRNGVQVAHWRFACLGVLFGLACLVKPHLGIGLPIVFGTLLRFRWRAQGRSLADGVLTALLTAAGLAAPMAVTAWWLSSHGALPAFLSVLRDYIPLHTALSGSNEVLTSSQRLTYLLTSTLKFGGYKYVVPVAVLAHWLAWRSRASETADDLAWQCIAMCTVAYAIYPTIGGKFWGYHYMPFAYFCALSMALLFWQKSPSDLDAPKQAKSHPWDAGKVLLISACLLLHNMDSLKSMGTDLRSDASFRAPRNGHIDELASWMREHVQPGDTVQPLDWASGVIHAMLLSKTPLATRFMYEYHFYHHVSSPVIQGLRTEFMQDMRAQKPRYIVTLPVAEKTWASGPDTSRSFPELERFLAESYTLKGSAGGFLILERHPL